MPEKSSADVGFTTLGRFTFRFRLDRRADPVLCIISQTIKSTDHSVGMPYTPSAFGTPPNPTIQTQN
ncbi:MAG: hypothetical protein AB1649_25595 [Chloroflexota bacterium]